MRGQLPDAPGGPGRPQYQVGGAVRKGALYATRPADTELPRHLRQGEFCFVLAPRQMGKSSLKVRSAEVLRGAGCRCVELDLTDMGAQDITPDQWYFGLIDEIALQLDLDLDLPAWWEEHRAISPVHRWSRFLRDRLGSLGHALVIFIDEIDGVLGLPFSTDDFFASIRATYNQGAGGGQARSLTFCLLGVAAPTDLMKDASRTPFNVGRPVPLEDFSRREAQALVPGLRGASEEPMALLDAVLDWTSGHPYMTQRICAALADEGPTAESAAPRVARMVSELFLEGGPVGDSNLETARERVLRSGSLLPDMLRLYRRVLDGERVPWSERSPPAMALRLAGLISVRQRAGRSILVPRNRIFSTVFDRAWVHRLEEDRPFAENLARWLQESRGDDYVLRGEALARAVSWARDRRDLTPEESAFLLQGLTVARREELERLEVARADQERTLESERRRAVESQTRLQRRYIAVMAVALILLAGALVQAVLMVRQAARSDSEAAVKAFKSRMAAEAALSEEEARRRIEETRGELATFQQEVDEAWQRVAEKESEVREAQEQLSEVMAQLERTRHEAEAAYEEAQGAAQRAEELESQAQAALEREREALQSASSAQSQLSEALQARQEAVDQARVARAAAEEHLEEAERLRTQVQSTERVALAQMLASVPGRSGDSLVAAIQGVTLRPEGAALSHAVHGLAQVLDQVGGPVLASLGEPVTALDISPDGQGVIVGSAGGELRLIFPEAARSLTLDRGDGEAISAAVYSPDGEVLLISSTGGAHAILDPRDGRPQLQSSPADESRGPILSARWAPDGASFALARNSGEVELRERSGALLHRLSGHRDPVIQVAFVPGTGHILTVDAEGQARLWRGDGTEVERLSAGSSRPAMLGLSPAGPIALVGGPFVDLYSGQTGRLEARIEPPSNPLSLDFSPDGSRLLVGCADGVGRIYSAGEAGPTVGELLLSLPGVGRSANLVSYGPEGRQAVVGGEDGSARIHDARTGQVLARLEGHQGALLHLGWSPRGQHLLTGSADGSARLWSTRGGLSQGPLLWHNDIPRVAHFSPDGRWLLTAGDDATPRLWPLGDAQAEPVALEGHRGPLSAALFIDGGRRIVSAGQGGQILIHETGRASPLKAPIQAPGPVDLLAAAPDGHGLAAASRDGSILVISAADSAVVFTLSLQRGRPVGLAFSPEGSRLAAATSSGTVAIWDSAGGALLARRDGIARALSSLAYGEAGPVVGTAGGHVERLSPRDLSSQARIRAHRGAVESLAIMEAQGLLLSASQDRSAALLSSEDLQVQGRLQGHRGAVWQALPAPDGSRVLTASADGTARLWDVGTALPLAVYRGHGPGKAVRAVAFSPDGHRAATVGDDHAAMLSPASAQAMLTQACAWLKLSPESYAGLSQQCEALLGP